MSKSCRPTPVFRRRQRGFSLIEVLVSIVVLSFGMLGMVGLQAAALQANREAKYQSAAVNLARELSDMMRGNKKVATDSGAVNPYLGSFTAPLAAATPTYCLNVTPASPCSAVPETVVGANNATQQQVAIANAQMTEWLARVDAELPGARVVVCYDATPFDASGLPQWACSNSGDTAIVKLGWTRGSTNRSNTGAAALEKATVPSVVLPLSAGTT